jgi:hypothetical protein
MMNTCTCTCVTVCTHGVNYILSTGIIAFNVLGTSGDIASQ